MWTEQVVVSSLKDYPRDSLRDPGQKTTEVYGAAGAKVYVTAWHANVQVTSDGENYTVKTERERQPKCGLLGV